MLVFTPIMISIVIKYLEELLYISTFKLYHLEVLG